LQLEIGQFSLQFFVDSRGGSKSTRPLSGPVKRDAFARGVAAIEDVGGVDGILSEVYSQITFVAGNASNTDITKFEAQVHLGNAPDGVES
jgi:hypothetical protein